MFIDAKEPPASTSIGAGSLLGIGTRVEIEVVAFVPSCRTTLLIQQIIAAYTGARINEITPLVARDFVKRDGIWMIRIRGANNKTRTFREVPLHSHLIDQGLLDYPPLTQPHGRRIGLRLWLPHEMARVEIDRP